MIQMCHAWQYWQERPAKLPNIRRYVAVDEAVRDRLVHMEGIAASRVEILSNAVDLTRLPPRAEPLAARPRRALAFTKHKAQIPLLEQACRRHGVRLDVLGQGGERVVAHPEAELVKYDLVFATARMAMEAAAAGSAVVICDARGMAGMLRTDNVEQLRPLNFGLRCLVHPVSTGRLSDEIARYDAADATRVADTLRRTATLEQTLDRLEQLYGEILDEARDAPIPAAAQRAAQLGFLTEALPRTRLDGRWPWLVERSQLTSRIEVLERELAEARALLGEAGRLG
jgi:hypothetical protein